MAHPSVVDVARGREERTAGRKDRKRNKGNKRSARRASNKRTIMRIHRIERVAIAGALIGLGALLGVAAGWITRTGGR